MSIKKAVIGGTAIVLVTAGVVLAQTTPPGKQAPPTGNAVSRVSRNVPWRLRLLDTSSLRFV